MRAWLGWWVELAETQVYVVRVWLGWWVESGRKWAELAETRVYVVRVWRWEEEKGRRDERTTPDTKDTAQRKGHCQDLEVKNKCPLTIVQS